MIKETWEVNILYVLFFHITFYHGKKLVMKLKHGMKLEAVADAEGIEKLWLLAALWFAQTSSLQTIESPV